LLQPVLLGQGDPNAAVPSSTLQVLKKDGPIIYNPDAALDYDTFLRRDMFRASFPDAKIIVDGREEVAEEGERRRRRLNTACEQLGLTASGLRLLPTHFSST
jgi:hypothetical protein